jgi:arylsulfatase A-like enzyme
MHGPGFEPGTYEGLSQAVDIVPTVLGRLGLPPHPSFQGLDLVSSKADPSRAAYIVAQTPKADQLAMVKGGYKILFDYWYETYVLFDIARDPGEKRDLAELEPGRLRVMANQLRSWERAQFAYYADRRLMSTTYPPLMVARSAGAP